MAIIPLMLKAVIFDLGHTILHEEKGKGVPLSRRPINLMPGVRYALPRIELKMGIWANTKRAKERGVRQWLIRAGINHYFTWVVTSVDAGSRKPSKEFFDFALRKCGLDRQNVLFVGNQLNSDIRGALQYGINHVWLSARAYRSKDETMTLKEIQPMYTIKNLRALPDLVDKLTSRK